MNRNDYPAFVLKIWCEPEPNERSLAIAGLGIIGECGEVCEVLLGDPSLTDARKLVDEAGDVLYYATVLADWKGMHVEDIWPDLRPEIVPKFEAGLMLCRDAKEVSERVKKFIRDDADPSAEDMRKYLRQVLVSLQRILTGVGANLYDALDENVKKLKVRYAHAL